MLLCALLLTGCQAAQQKPVFPLPQLPSHPADGDYENDPDNRTVRAGTVTTALAGSSGGTLSHNDPYPGSAGKDYTDPAQYTFREYLSSTSGLQWAPHTWQTADDSYILNYTTTGFYDFALNADGSGWTVLDEMAAGLPRDVTAQYVGHFGILPGDQARAWQIDLNENACWENGVPIQADTYLYSYRELLDGRMMNRRADSLYAGEFAIAGAKEYLYGEGSWEDVGILKTGDYQLVLITTAPISGVMSLMDVE